MKPRSRRVEDKRNQLRKAAAEFRTTPRYKVMKGIAKGLPMSGSEESFTDMVYGSKKGIDGNNCYGFAVDWYRDGGYKKLQPGELAGTARPEDDLTTCPTLARRTLEDLKLYPGGGYLVAPEARCKPGYYKIMSFVDPGNDYHWYRQFSDFVVKGGKPVANIARETSVEASQINSPSPSPTEDDLVVIRKSGLWAHKRGLDELTYKDSSGRYIVDPRRATKKYEDLNYTKFCHAFCVNKDFGKGL